MEGIDAVRLAFDPSGLLALNAILAFIMFGVALDLRVDDFRGIVRQPRAAAAGLFGQLLALPAVTFLLTLLLDLPGSVELGMILVAACPGGNVSNFLTSHARGNASLSISMTAVVTTLAVVTTPANVGFWGSMSPDAASVLRSVSIDPVRMVSIVALIIVLPVICGMLVRKHRSDWADRQQGRFRVASIFFLFLFIAIALANNIGPAVDYVPVIAGIVITHNVIALGLGRLIGEAARLPEPDKRTLTIEVGIQNSGLGLVLIFSFFDGLGGMAVVAAFWGIWHLISGLALATWWRSRPPE